MGLRIASPFERMGTEVFLRGSGICITFWEGSMGVAKLIEAWSYGVLLYSPLLSTHSVKTSYPRPAEWGPGSLHQNYLYLAEPNWISKLSSWCRKPRLRESPMPYKQKTQGRLHFFTARLWMGLAIYYLIFRISNTRLDPTKRNPQTPSTHSWPQISTACLVGT